MCYYVCGEVRLMPLLLLFLLLGGCVTLTGEEKEEKEYQRLDYIEGQFKPAVIHCKNTGGSLLRRPL